jgi:RNA recognition motif-containing protein
MSDAPAAVPAVSTPAAEEPGFKVFAGNLAYSTTHDGLKTFFAPVEKDIINAQVIFRGSRSAGYGFVTFNTQEAANSAAELLNGKELEGRVLIVEAAKPKAEKEKDRSEKRSAKKRQGRRGGKAATGEVSEAEANGTAPQGEKKEGDADAPADGAAKPKKKKSPRKPRRKAAPANGDAAVKNDAPAAEGEVKEKPAKKPKAPRAPRAPRPAGEQPDGNPSKTMLFVANLGFVIDDAALTEIFTAENLHVVSARIVRRRWGQPRRSKGYGFVDVGSEEEQHKAIKALNGKEIGGREIAVKIAVDEKPREGKEDATPEAVVVAT